VIRFNLKWRNFKEHVNTLVPVMLHGSHLGSKEAINYVPDKKTTN
jgi:hypothetical protein